jgi:hypothetical protein
MRMSSRLLLAGMLGFCLGWTPVCPADSMEEQTVLAALSLNIVRFTAWPPEFQQIFKDGIRFCVYGDNVVQQSFTSIDHKPVENFVLEVVNLSRLNNVEQCHVLYINEMKQNLLLQLFMEFKGKPLLTIGLGESFAEAGGMVGLENIEGKIKMHVNLNTMRDSGLTISARLLKLARVIGN